MAFNIFSINRLADCGTDSREHLTVHMFFKMALDSRSYIFIFKKLSNIIGNLKNTKIILIVYKNDVYLFILQLMFLCNSLFNGTIVSICSCSFRNTVFITVNKLQEA